MIQSLIHVAQDTYGTKTPHHSPYPQIYLLIIGLLIFVTLYLSSIYITYPEGFDQLNEAIRWWFP